MRRTRLAFHPAPDELKESLASFQLHLRPRGEQILDVTVSFESGRKAPRTLAFGKALERSTMELEARHACCATVETSNARFNDWLDRSSSDLQMMITETPHGLYPYAGLAASPARSALGG